MLLIKRLGSRERDLPPPSDLRLYDFHFKEYRLDRRMLGWRKTVFPPQGVQRGGHDHEAEVRRREEARIMRDGGGGGGGGGMWGGERGHAEEGLWARLERYKARVVDVGDVGLMHSHAHHSDAAGGDEGEGEGEGEGDAGEVVEEEEEAELGVSATELIIEMMVLAMASEAEDDRSNINGGHRRARVPGAGGSHPTQGPALAVGRGPPPLHPPQPVQPVPLLHRRPAGRHRGPHRPLHRPLLPTPLPNPYAVYATGDLTDLYPQIYHRLTSALLAGRVTKELRFIVYSPSKLVPFDRHLRGVYFCFLVALVTERVLLIDLPEFHALYAPPSRAMSRGTGAPTPPSSPAAT